MESNSALKYSKLLLLRLNQICMLCVCHTTPTQKLFSSCWATTTGRLFGPKMGNSINSLFTWEKKWEIACKQAINAISHLGAKQSKY